MLTDPTTRAPSPDAATPAATAQIVQVARQPILAADDTHELLGYELRFRDNSLFGAFADVDDSQATSEVVSHALLTLGIDRVVGDSKAFIAFPHRLLLDRTPLVLPSNKTILAVGPDAYREHPAGDVAATLAAYAERGYEVALKDFRYAPGIEPVLDIADYVKIDLASHSETARGVLLPMLRRHDLRVVAVNIDNEEARDVMVASGADYVEGFFFSEPRIVEGAELPGFKVAYLQLMRKAYSLDVDFDELAEIVKSDVALSYKLLRYINSAAMGVRQEVDSVTRALTLLGVDQIRRWVGLATVSGLVDPRPRELAVLCATRARFCEHLGERLRVASSHNAFSLGMFSLLPAMLGRTMAESLADVSVSDDVAAALHGASSPLRDLLDACIAYERGDWDRVSQLSADRGWPETELIGAYLQALEWARDFFGTDNIR